MNAFATFLIVIGILIGAVHRAKPEPKRPQDRPTVH